MLFFALIYTQLPDQATTPLIEATRQRQDLSSIFFAIEPTIRFRGAVTPERLKEIYTVRSLAHEDSDPSKRVASFLFELKKSSLTPLVFGISQHESKGRGIDVRYGLAVNDGAGHPLLWVCSNAGGDLAIIESRVYRLSGPLSAWFRSEGQRLLALKRAGKNP